MNDKYVKYLIIAVQILTTILVVNHWYRGLEYLPLLILWIIMLGLSISPILDLIYGNVYCCYCSRLVKDMIYSATMNKDDWLCRRCFEEKTIEYDAEEYAKSIDQSDYTPHKEEMEEEYQPYE